MITNLEELLTIRKGYVFHLAGKWIYFSEGRLNFPSKESFLINDCENLYKITADANSVSELIAKVEEHYNS